MEKLTFEGYNPVLQIMRMDKAARVIFDTSADQWENVREIHTLPQGIYSITIELIEKSDD